MFKKALLIAALGTVTLISGAVAQAGDAAKPNQQSKRVDCFFNRQVQNFTATNDDKTLYVRAGRDVYRMEMFGRCLDMSASLNIALDSSPGSSICSAQDVQVLVNSNGMGPQRCPVRTLTKLTPAEVAALPKRDKP